jgi:hypothetical protein
MVAGQPLCAVLTLWYVAPWVMLINAQGSYPHIISFVQSFIVTFFQGLVFTHVNSHPSGGNKLNSYVLNAIAEAELLP